MAASSVADAATAASSSCAYSAAEVDELMTCDGGVDMERLREAARLGCAGSVRGRVWKYLLGVTRADHTDEVAAAQRRKVEFARLQSEQRVMLAPDTLRRLRAEIRRYTRHQPRSLSPGTPGDDATDNGSNNSDADADDMERMLVLYLANHRSKEYDASLVYLLAPFMAVLRDPSDVYYCFATLREYMESVEAQSEELWLAKFMMLFRTFDGDLCTHFEDEEVRPNEWAIPWLRHLLCKELPMACVLRLWDRYLADSGDVELHIFVCLAILGRCKEALLECEYSELKAMLRHLPDMDMNQILAQAENLQNQVSMAWDAVE